VGDAAHELLALSEKYGEPIEVKSRVTRFEKVHSKRWEHGKRCRVCGGQRTEEVRKEILYVG
jgi:hypothetical protein